MKATVRTPLSDLLVTHALKVHFYQTVYVKYHHEN